MVNRKLSAGWNAWAEMVAMKKEFFQLLRKGLSFMMNRKLALGYAGWKEGWLHRVGRGIAASSMSRALSYFVNRELSRGWVGWRATYEELVAKRASLRRGGLSHMMNRKLSAGWNAWFEMVAMKHEFVQLLRKGLSMMVNRKLALGYAGWRYAWEVATGKGAAPGPWAGHGVLHQPRALARLAGLVCDGREASQARRDAPQPQAHGEPQAQRRLECVG